MLINTKFLGKVEIDEREIIGFDLGLPGFPDEKEFVLLPLEADTPLALLQSIKQEKNGFVVAYPFAYKSDYSFELSDEEIEELQIADEKDVITYTVVTLQNSLEESTMNLLAPIVVNVKNKKGKQVVLLDIDKYPLKYAIGNLEGSAK